MNKPKFGDERKITCPTCKGKLTVERRVSYSFGKGFEFIKLKDHEDKTCSNCKGTGEIEEMFQPIPGTTVGSWVKKKK